MTTEISARAKLCSLVGVELHLDCSTDGPGYALFRDDSSNEDQQVLLGYAAFSGWWPIDDDEAVEPYEFPDGALGVKVWLCRESSA